jgi:toxin FitB
MSRRMEYLLDTNVVSEIRRKQRNEQVVSFLDSIDPSRLFISVLTLGELRKGIDVKKRSDPGAAKLIENWVDGLESSYADRLLGVDGATARLWGELSADRTRPVIDTLLAATAIVRGMTFVTRNAGDVAGIEVPVLNPWRKP